MLFIDLNFSFALSGFQLLARVSHYMRVKTPVHFRMAPKRSTKGKDAAAQPTRDEGWVPSKCSDSDLEALVSAGLLPTKSLLLPLILNVDWGSHVLVSSLGSCLITRSSSTI